MTPRPTLMTQREAASYLTEKGYPIHETQLSLLGKTGDGPRFTKLGSTKVFYEEDLDAWLAAKLDTDTDPTVA
jgi:hypothetical protein